MKKLVSLSDTKYGTWLNKNRVLKKDYFYAFSIEQILDIPKY